MYVCIYIYKPVLNEVSLKCLQQYDIIDLSYLTLNPKPPREQLACKEMSSSSTSRQSMACSKEHIHRKGMHCTYALAPRTQPDEVLGAHRLHMRFMSRLELNTTGTEGRATRTRTPTETYRKLEEQTVHIHTYVFFKHVHEYVCAICLCAHVCVSQCINPETPYLQVE